jgi:membrane protease YdiL (CAAX protease family)
LLAVVTLAAALLTLEVKGRSLGWGYEYPRLSLRDPVRALYTKAERARQSAQAGPSVLPAWLSGTECELCSEAEVDRAFDALLEEGGRYRASGHTRKAGPRWREQLRAARLVTLAGWGRPARLADLQQANLREIPDYMSERAAELASGQTASELQRVSHARGISFGWWARSLLMLFALATAVAWKLGLRYPRRPARALLKAPLFWRGLVVFVWAEGFRSACTLFRWESPDGPLGFMPLLPSLVPAAVTSLLLIGTRLERTETPVKSLLQCPPDRRSQLMQLGLALAATGVLVGFWRLAWPPLHYAGLAPDWSENVNETLLFGTPSEVALRVFSSSVLAPFGEELLFRGALFGCLATRLSTHRAALVSAMVFAAVHGYGLLGSAFVGLSGYLWARLDARVGSLLPSMVSHSLGNTLVTVARLTWR